MSPQPDPSVDPEQGDDRRRQVSAAMDGDTEALGQALGAWRDEPATRATWHAYHLVGDALRSSELAAAPAHDAAFLQQLRAKLALEPVVLAPSPPAPKKRPAAAWAVAASLAAVAGVVVVVTRLSAPPSEDRLAAAAGVSESRQVVLGTPASQSPGQTSVVRNARLDEFLRAHQAARGAMAVPGSGLYRAAIELPAGSQQ